MGGQVTLGDGWVFTKNKDSISENCDELEEAIFTRIEHLLIKADQASIDVQSTQIRTELASMLNSAVKTARRESRDLNGGSRGTVSPVGTDRKRRNATNVHSDSPGSVDDAGNKRRRGMQIDWCSIADTDIGKYDTRANTVNLNLSHSFVALAKSSENYQALFAVAFAVYSDYICMHKEGGQKTMFEVEDFGGTYGKLMKGMKFND